MGSFLTINPAQSARSLRRGRMLLRFPTSLSTASMLQSIYGIVVANMARFFAKLLKAKTYVAGVIFLVVGISIFVVNQHLPLVANHTSSVVPSGGFHACNVVGQTQATSVDTAISGAPDTCNGTTSTVD